jgi:NTE family protein
MLFHLGALWRLNELGWLVKLNRISSVSGGSITAGLLARNWNQLDFDADGRARAFLQAVAEPLHELAGETIDVPAALGGTLLPGSVSDRVAASYDKHLFHGTTLQQLPDQPRFVINATNLQSGVLWRFSKPYMWDYRVGKIANPTELLAIAVAASSAFPPFLSPLTLKLAVSDYVPNSGVDLQQPPFQKRVVLSDGGVYDNLGLETAWKRYKTILVSDGGGHLAARSRIGPNWLSQAARVSSVIDGQVRALRKRQVIGGFAAGLRAGTYWGIRSDVASFGLPDALPCSTSGAQQLADTPTRLAKLKDARQQGLVNWGYAICDAAIRKHVAVGAPAPSSFPYPAVAV